MASKAVDISGPQNGGTVPYCIVRHWAKIPAEWSFLKLGWKFRMSIFVHGLPGLYMPMSMHVRVSTYKGKICCCQMQIAGEKLLAKFCRRSLTKISHPTSPVHHGHPCTNSLNRQHVLHLVHQTYSSGWWFQTFFVPFHIWDVILPIDELHHFSRWLLHHQADIILYYIILYYIYHYIPIPRPSKYSLKLCFAL